MPEQSVDIDLDSLPDEGEALGPVVFEGKPTRSTAELYMASPAVNDQVRKSGSAIVGVSLAV